MGDFFQTEYSRLVESPNGRMWWHCLPLPDGSRINGASLDKDREFKIWNALQIANEGGLEGKSVLDIGANDGFFSIAAGKAGARRVTGVNSADWSTWPHNLQHASKTWNVPVEIVSADFRYHEFPEPFDVIFFLGVLYHLQDVFGCMVLLRDLLAERGTIYVETALSQVQSRLPLFEYASDVYPTVARQDKAALSQVGISNYLFPNEAAMINLAHSYDFDCFSLEGPRNRYTPDHPFRNVYKLVKKAPGASAHPDSLNAGIGRDDLKK